MLYLEDYLESTYALVFPQWTLASPGLRPNCEPLRRVMVAFISTSVFAVIEHLPQELRDRFTEIREMDLQVQSTAILGVFSMVVK